MKILFSIQLLAAITFVTFSPAPFIFASTLNQANIEATITYSQLPRNLQFFARDNQDSAYITFAGVLFSLGYDSMYLEVYKNNVLSRRKSIKLTYTIGNTAFSIGDKIHSELSEYKLKLYLKAGVVSTLINSADSLVSGDAYIICGQSNSHPTDPAANYSNEFCRSFGIQTANINSDVYNPADTNWGFSKADGAVYYWSGPYNVGEWGLNLQKQIRNNFGIPTCIINGGKGGSTIEMNERNNSNQTDLTSIYGKLLYRVIKSGLANKIKAIFWYQGESNGDNSWVNYTNNFQTLYNSWKENYPGFKKIFLFQTRPCCSEQYASQLREEQRELPLTFPDIELISTAGVPYYEGCHYDYYGYMELSNIVFRPLSKIFYSTSDTVDMRPPNVKAAYYTSALKNEIAILFDNSRITEWPADTLGQSMKNYFYLDGAIGNVNYGVISGDTLKLKLISPGTATKITYLPTVWDHDDSLVYEGPFLRNSKRIGALSFNDFPITNNPPTYLNLTAIIDGYYNNALNMLNTRDSLTVILRNNYYPYLKCDSAKAPIDSVSYTGVFRFNTITSGSYYIVVKGSNSLETWSKSGGMQFTAGATMSYDFTTAASQAYGNNLKLNGSKYCIFSSDLNQDGSVNLVDNIYVFNDAINFSGGTMNTDLNGDNIVDLNDVYISYNTLTSFAHRLTP